MNAIPAELFLKRQLRTVPHLLRPTATDASEKNRKRYKSNFDRLTKRRFFNPEDKVLMRDIRDSQVGVKWTPIKRSGSRVWNVTVGTPI